MSLYDQPFPDIRLSKIGNAMNYLRIVKSTLCGTPKLNVWPVSLYHQTFSKSRAFYIPQFSAILIAPPQKKSKEIKQDNENLKYQISEFF